jgi:deoxycytidylate deaminase
MLSEETIIEAYAFAFLASYKSICKDKKVGVALLDKNGSMICTGYNYVEECRDDCKLCPVIHAETVAMIKLDMVTTKPLYSVQTLFPCEKCQMLLYNKGVKKVFYVVKTKVCLGLLESEYIGDMITEGGIGEIFKNKKG